MKKYDNLHHIKRITASRRLYPQIYTCYAYNYHTNFMILGTIADFSLKLKLIRA